MANSRVSSFRLTIPSGESESNFAIGPYVYSDAAGLMIHSPDGLLETVKIEVSGEIPSQTALASSITWNEYQVEAGTDVTVPAAGKSAPYAELVLAGSLRLKSSTNVAADRVFIVTKLGTLPF